MGDLAMSVVSWIHNQVTWPVIQNLAAAALGAGFVIGGQQYTALSGGCTAAVVEELTTGEAALAGGDWVKAHAISSDVVAEAPNCRWANTFSAAVSLDHIHRTTNASDIQIRELDRVNCYERALKARPLFNQDPRVNALLYSCKATTRLQG